MVVDPAAEDVHGRGFIVGIGHFNDHLLRPFEMPDEAVILAADVRGSRVQMRCVQMSSFGGTNSNLYEILETKFENKFK